MGATKVTCNATSKRILWRLTDKSTHKVYYGRSERCGAVVFKNKLVSHMNSEACAGSPLFFADYDEYIMECYGRVKNGEKIPGFHIKKGNDGAEYICLDEDFRRTPKMVELTKAILTKSGFHRAVFSSQQLKMFFVTALADGIDKHLGNVNKSLLRIIEAFRVKGIEAFNFLGINCIDAEVMEDVVVNMMDAFHEMKGRIVGVEANVLKLAQKYIELNAEQETLTIQVKNGDRQRDEAEAAIARLFAKQASIEEELKDLKQDMVRYVSQKTMADAHEELIRIKELTDKRFKGFETMIRDVQADVARVEQQQQDQGTQIDAQAKLIKELQAEQAVACEALRGLMDKYEKIEGMHQGLQAMVQALPNARPLARLYP